MLFSSFFLRVALGVRFVRLTKARPRMKESQIRKRDKNFDKLKVKGKEYLDYSTDVIISTTVTWMFIDVHPPHPPTPPTLSPERMK